MNRIPVILMLGLLVLLTCAGTGTAGKRGDANLLLRQRVTETTTPSVKVGDVLEVETLIEASGAAITQVTLFLTFDDRFLEIIPSNPGGSAVRPFSQGGWLSGQLFFNDTMGDGIGNSDANQIPGFQIRYSELIPRFQGAPQRVAVGRGVAARFLLRVIRKPGGGTTRINVNTRSPTGGETGYFVRGDAGSIYNFRQITPMTVTVKGLDLSVQLPDLHVRPGQVDSSLDLDDFLNDPVNPDSTIVWISSIPDPDRIQVSVDSTSHVVTVDPTDFIGIAGVAFTATTTRFSGGETAGDSIRVIVDTPPAFDTSGIADTIRFQEDTDTTLVLVATDVDPGAVLSFSSLDPDTATNISAFFDDTTPSGTTTRAEIKLTPRQDFFGSEVRRFRVEDQFGLADSMQVVVVVTPVNDPPEFIQDFPLVEIGLLGQELLELNQYVEDVDDPFEALQLRFSGSDSIAINVSPGNARLTITAVPPFSSTDSVEVSVRDPSNALAVQWITVGVIPPGDPRPPSARSPLKVDVRAGGGSIRVDLDTLVADPDTPDNLLRWTHVPVPLVRISQVALSLRRLEVSAESDSTGFRPTTLRVTDLNGLSDTLAVRIYSSSLTSGLPVAGGLPDTALIAGTTGSFNLDDYYFDANHTDAQVEWTSTGQNDIGVQIASTPPHQVVLQAPEVTSRTFEDIVFRVEDPDGNTALDTMRVHVHNPGSVVLDLSAVGGSQTIFLGRPDTLGLKQLLQVGDVSNIVWEAKSENNTTVFTQVLPNQELLLLGIQQGETEVELTATDVKSGNSDTADLQVLVRPEGETGFAVRDVGPLTLRSGRDTTLQLNDLVVSGNPGNVFWSSITNPEVGVVIDSSRQVAILRPADGAAGVVGAIIFRATERTTKEEKFSRAAPVEVVGGAGPDVRGLLEISVVVNPVLKNFLKVFVISKLELLGDPFLGLEIRGGGNGVKPILVDAVEQEGAGDVWVGDLVLTNAVTGVVELSATGITQGTRIALTDTLAMEVRQAEVVSTFLLSTEAVSLALPKRALSAPSVVALIPEQGKGSDLPADALRPASGVYRVHAPTAEVRRAGEIRFRFAGTSSKRAQTGVYRWDETAQQWRFAGSRQVADEVAGAFSAFGRYGLFVDEVAPAAGDPEVLAGGEALAIPVEENGSGVDPESVILRLNGAPVEAVYSAGRVVWTAANGFEPGIQTLRLELTDLAGNQTVWERRVDLGALMPGPAEYVLHQNFPNPFNPETVIRFEIPGETEVRLTIYNMLGQEVRRLLEKQMAAGHHTVSWDARDAYGQPVGAGVYFYRLEAPEMALTRKMVLVK